MLSMNRRLTTGALIAVLAVPFAVSAAEEAAPPEDKPATEQAQKKTEKKVRPHQHQADAKQGAVAPEPHPVGEPKKPLHDHQKFHK